MDRPAEMVLDHGLEEVADAHGRTACGEDEVGGAEAALQSLDVCLQAALEVRRQLV